MIIEKHWRQAGRRGPEWWEIVLLFIVIAYAIVQVAQTLGNI